MAQPFLSIRGVDFSYPSAPDPVIRDLTASFSPGFTGIVGPNGAGKTTLLKLAADVLKPADGLIDCSGIALYCHQRTDDPPADLLPLLDDTGAPVYALRSRLGVEWDWHDRWDTLSHGERKRAQVACALWRKPDILAIDEPTNHLDMHAKQLLIESLRDFPGVGLIVSHDRDLLDQLCSHCLWLEGSRSRMYPGSYTEARAARAVEAKTAERDREKAVRTRKALAGEAIMRRQQENRAEKAKSKRGITSRDHDAKARANAARVTDSGSGQRLRQLDGRLAQAERAVEEARTAKSYRVGIELPGTICRRDTLFSIPSSDLPIGNARHLRVPDLTMRPTDRIALVGPNGTGKSTLIRHIARHLNVESDRVINMPQELSEEEGREVLRAVKALPKEELGHAMNVVSCLGSRPAALLGSATPSPGELRKLLLALGMTARPYLLMLDEPTNHLDLPSIEALEAALASCECGLLLASHDESFLKTLTDSVWRIDRDERGRSTLQID